MDVVKADEVINDIYCCYCQAYVTQPHSCESTTTRGHGWISYCGGPGLVQPVNAYRDSVYYSSDAHAKRRATDINKQR